MKEGGILSKLPNSWRVGFCSDCHGSLCHVGYGTDCGVYECGCGHVWRYYVLKAQPWEKIK